MLPKHVPGVAWLKLSSPRFKYFQELFFCLDGATIEVPEQKDWALQLLMLPVCGSSAAGAGVPIPCGEGVGELGLSLCSISC